MEQIVFVIVVSPTLAGQVVQQPGTSLVMQEEEEIYVSGKKAGNGNGVVLVRWGFRVRWQDDMNG